MSPAKIFWIDACGALLSARLLGIVLTSFASEFGARATALRALTAVALVYLLFDRVGFIARPRRAPWSLTFIAIANVIDPLLPAVVLATDDVELTPLGFNSVADETLIVWTLATFERHAALARA